MDIISKKVAFLLLKLGYLDTKIRIFLLDFEYLYTACTFNRNLYI